jgi:hypothetical protein
MDKKIWLIVAMITAFIVGFVLSDAMTIAQPLPKQEAPQTTPLPVPTPTPVPARTSEFKGAYMGGCLDEEGANYAYCECTYKYMVREYGTDGLEKIAIIYDSGKLNNEVEELLMDAVYACAKHL